MVITIAMQRFQTWNIKFPFSSLPNKTSTTFKGCTWKSTILLLTPWLWQAKQVATVRERTYKQVGPGLHKSILKKKKIPAHILIVSLVIVLDAVKTNQKRKGFCSREITSKHNTTFSRWIKQTGERWYIGQRGKKQQSQHNSCLTAAQFFVI